MQNSNVKYLIHKNNLPYNLQFFASKDDGSSNNEDDNKDDNDGNQKHQEDTGSDNDGDQGKTFTQEEVIRMMTREKREGKQSALKALGFKTEKEAQDAMKLYKALVDSQKTEVEKNAEQNKKMEESKNDAEERAFKAECKLACVFAGVQKDSIDDILSIALNKVTEEKTLDVVLEEMKRETKYSGFFGEEQKETGTGTDPAHVKNKGGKESVGKRLAERNVSANKKKKSSYFD